jgi:hypothetical protein
MGPWQRAELTFLTTMKRPVGILVVGFALLNGAASMDGLAQMTIPGADPALGRALPPGDVREDTGCYAVEFYYAPDPKADTLATATALVKKYLPTVPLATNSQSPLQPPFVGFEEQGAPVDPSQVPDLKSLQYFGRGLSDQDAANIQKTNRATGLTFIVPKDEVWTMGRKFTELVEEFSQTTGAYIWDSTSEECFTADSWNTRRLSTWPASGVPDVSHQYNVHLYKPGDDSKYLRAITLGMSKFALPDIVIERINAGDSRPAGNLINLVAQSLAEHPVIKSGEKEVFGLQSLADGAWKSKIEASLESGATKEITLALLSGNRLDGDPENRLIEISFQNGVGETEDERRNDLLSKLWGSKDTIVAATHSPEVLAASARAKAKLPALRDLFQKGLPVGGRLLLEAPFAIDTGGNEWMWVEITNWSNADKPEGILQDDPFYVHSLKAGAHVTIDASQVFDYTLYHADGTKEGNETEKLIEAQGGQTIRK